jgi:glycolate oxidase iron-sulfur subunit
MQTTFTDAQLADPAIQRSNEILRSCVHCGFCTATCPTYQVLGDELDSPRGRIYLIKDMLEQGRPADERTVKHIDRCLSCLACMTTCPSGVHYMHLVDHAREYIEADLPPPPVDRMLRWVLARVLPHPTRFRLALLGAKIGRPFAFLMPDARLRAMLAMAPRHHPARQPQRRSAGLPGPGPPPDAGGADDGLRAKGAEHRHQRCHDPPAAPSGVRGGDRRGQGCCGALTHHMGKADRIARHRRRRQHRAPSWRKSGRGAGCGGDQHLGLRHDGQGLRPHVPQRCPWRQDAAVVAGLAMDISELLVKLGLPEGAPKGLRVAYHAACSLQHGQQIKTAPKDLLKRAGFEVVEPADSHLCCGSAGTYNLLQPEISGQLRPARSRRWRRSCPTSSPPATSAA